MSTGLSLIKKLCTQGARQAFRQVNPDHFLPDERPCFDFVASYYRDHGQLPTMEALADNGYNLIHIRDNEAASYYMERLANRHVIMTARGVLQDFNEAVTQNVPERVREIVAELNAVFRTSIRGGQIMSLSEAVDMVLERYEEARTNPGIQGLTLGYDWLDEITGGAQPGDVITLAARTNMGKAQPLDAKVLTPLGWKRMGDLRVGDRLASVDGRASEVVAIHPQGVKQVYRVAFADGASAECCADHLWRVHCAHWPERWRVIDTAELARLLGVKRYENRLSVETFDGEFGTDAGLPLDPYVLGCLLGDGGCTQSPKLTSADAEIVERFRSRLPARHDIIPVRSARYGYEVCENGSGERAMPGANRVAAAMRQLGLHGLRSHEKFIPECYLSASRTARLELLRGLLDTDGWAQDGCVVQVSTSSRALADGIWTLARSLGAVVRRRTKRTTHRDAHILTISHKDPASLFALPRKSEAVARRKSVRATIKSVMPSRETECQCITVSHPSHLYVTDDFVVTHNSYYLNHMSMSAWLIGASCLMISNEMTGLQMATRFVAQYTGINPDMIRRGTLNPWTRERMISECQSMREGAPYTIADGSFRMGVSDVDNLIQEFNPDIVYVDASYLLIPEETRFTAKGWELQREMSKEIKRIAMARNKPIVQTVQLNRDAVKKKAEDLDVGMIGGTDGIGQDSTTVIILAPGASPDEETTRDLIVAKNREGRKSWMRTHFLFNPMNFEYITSREDQERGEGVQPVANDWGS